MGVTENRSGGFPPPDPVPSKRTRRGPEEASRETVGSDPDARSEGTVFAAAAVVGREDDGNLEQSLSVDAGKSRAFRFDSIR